MVAAVVVVDAFQSSSKVVVEVLCADLHLLLLHPTFVCYLEQQQLNGCCHQGSMVLLLLLLSTVMFGLNFAPLFHQLTLLLLLQA